MIKASEARALVDKSNAKARAAKDRRLRSRKAAKSTSLAVAVFGRVQHNAKKGRGFLVCRGSKQCAEELRANGFRCVLVLGVLWVRW